MCGSSSRSRPSAHLRRLVAPVAVLAVLFLSGCGGDGNDIEPSVLETKISEAPGGAKQTGVFVFPVGEGFNLSDAVLVIGNPGRSDARHPYPLHPDPPVMSCAGNSLET